MTEAIQAVLLLLIALTGTLVVSIREPVDQTVAFGVYGLLLSLLFFALQAPDVAFSQIVVGSAVLPFMILITLMRMRRPP